MTNGPIEFMGESPPHLVPPSEYGGDDGLIQPPPHDVTPGEASAALTRAAMYGNELADDVVVDPHTGRVVPPDMNKAEG